MEQIFASLDISPLVIAVWVTAIISFSLFLVIILGSREHSARSFALIAFSAALWGVFEGLQHATNNPEYAFFFLKMTYIIAICSGASFLYFALSFPKNLQPLTFPIVGLTLLPAVFYNIFFEHTDLVIKGIQASSTPGGWVWEIGPYMWVFDLFLDGLWFMTLYILFKKWHSEIDESKQKHVKRMFFAFALGLIPAFFESILMHYFNIFYFDGLGYLTNLLWISLVSYSIVKYNQMNVKTVTTELLIISAILLLFASIFI